MGSERAEIEELMREVRQHVSEADALERVLMGAARAADTAFQRGFWDVLTLRPIWDRSYQDSLKVGSWFDV